MRKKVIRHYERRFQVVKYDWGITVFEQVFKQRIGWGALCLYACAVSLHRHNAPMSMHFVKYFQTKPCLTNAYQKATVESTVHDSFNAKKLLVHVSTCYR